MGMKEILAELDAQLIRGMEYTTPGETTKEREQTGYCLQPGSHCHTCSLVSYNNKDCRNNPVVDNEGGSCRRCIESRPEITIEEEKDGGYAILADGRYIESRSEGTVPNYRYLHGVKGTVNYRYQAKSVDAGPVPGETKIIIMSGQGWRHYFVAPRGHREREGKERENTGYCLQPGSHCHMCSLVNYGRDCRNNPVEDSGAILT